MVSARYVLVTLSALVALSACDPASPSTGDLGSAPSPSSAEGGSTTTEMPAELRGTWLDHWSTSMQYALASGAYDFESHIWFGGLPDLWDMAPNRGLGLSLAADGTFLWVRSADGGVGGCQSYSVLVIRGVAVAAGGVVTFHPTAQRERYTSTCDPSLDYDRDVPNEDFEMSFTLGATQDTGLPILRLTDESSGTSFDYFLGG